MTATATRTTAQPAVREWRFLNQGFAGHRCWAGVAEMDAATATPRDRLEARLHTDQLPAIDSVQNVYEAA